MWNSLDVFGSIEESVRAFCRVAATARTSHIACCSTHCMLDSRTAAQILHGIFRDKSFDAYMHLNLTNVFSAPITMTRYRLGTLLLQDVDGVEPHAVLMAVTEFHGNFRPNASHELATDITSPIKPLLLQPGEQNSATATVPMHWESVVRYMDELYMKNQNCLGVEAGRADLVLQGPAVDASAPPPHPVWLTFGFSPHGIGMDKRRACHLPATCIPARELISRTVAKAVAHAPCVAQPI